MSDLTKEKERLFNEVLGRKRAYEKEKLQNNSSFDEDLLDELQTNLKKDYGVRTKSNEKQVFLNAVMALKVKVNGEDDALEQLVNAFRRPYATGRTPGKPAGIILISGPAGTGKHMALQEITAYLKNNGIFGSGEISTVDLSRYTGGEDQIFRQDMYEACSSQNEVILFLNAGECASSFIRSLDELALTGKMTLAKRYVLTNGMLVENQTGLVKNTVDSLSADGKYLVFMRDDGQKSFQDIFGAEFLRHVTDEVLFQPLNEDALKAICHTQWKDMTEKCARQQHVEVQTDAEMEDWILRNYEKSRQAEGIEDLLEEVYRGISEVVMETGSESVEIRIENDEPYAYVNEKKYVLIRKQNMDKELAEINHELDQVVGLDNVKAYMHTLQAHEQAAERRRKQGLKTASVSRHMIFTGNPGTGKTTIARLIARYMKAIGVLSEGQLVEVTRSDLVARYVGQTAPQTLNVIKSALGGVLFIDEAYSLYRGKDDSFGLEAIDTLVKAMEDYRDNLIVILAGYKKEMKTFLEANSGLKSRFPNLIEFPDYTGKELTEIAELQAQGKGYVIAEDALKPLEEYFTQIQRERAAEAGNGRLARNTVEKAILHQSERIMNDSSADLSLLKKEDFNFSTI